jgi:hypothetical protein
MTSDPTVELLQRFFEAVSFEEGGRPAYGRLHALFVEGGRLIATAGPVPDVATLDGFVASRQPAVDSGSLTWFEEREIDGVTTMFGNVAHRLSRYAKAGRRDGEDFAVRGMISTQFVRMPAGWLISSMAWDDERPGLTLPD